MLAKVSKAMGVERWHKWGEPLNLKQTNKQTNKRQSSYYLPSINELHSMHNQQLIRWILKWKYKVNDVYDTVVMAKITWRYGILNTAWSVQKCTLILGCVGKIESISIYIYAYVNLYLYRALFCSTWDYEINRAVNIGLETPIGLLSSD